MARWTMYPQPYSGVQCPCCGGNTTAHMNQYGVKYFHCESCGHNFGR